MSEPPQPPVPWNDLKQLQDENAPRRPGCRQVTGLMLLGVSGMAFLVAGLAALDPREQVEPARYLFSTLLLMAFLTGLGGGFLLWGGDKPPGDDR